jgi:hypothetical protein
MEPCKTENQRLMVITIDTETGNVASVTDGEGKHFERFEPTDKNPLIFREVYNSVNVGTIFYARTNPCYKWYYREGSGWYRKEVACPS